MESKKAVKEVAVEYVEIEQAELDSLYYNDQKGVSIFGEGFNLVPRLQPYYGNKKKHKQDVVIELQSANKVIKAGNVVVSDGVVCSDIKEFKTLYKTPKN